MRFISSSPWSTSLILFLSVFQTVALSVDPLNIESRLVTRQDNSCLEYATVANLSTIDTNSTFRAAFLQAAPYGINRASGVLVGATKTLLKLINDPNVNQQCGNLTAVAIQEAPKNFTAGIIGPFKVAAETLVPPNDGIDVILSVLLAVLLFGGVSLAL